MLDTLDPGIPGLAILVAMGVVALGAVVQRTLGMGFGQVAAPLLLLIDPAFVPMAVILMGAFVASHAAIRERERADRRQVAIALVGRLIGALLAGWLVARWIDTALFSRLFGIMILLAVLISLKRWPIRPTPPSLLLAGTASGFMGTITSVGAPPMGLVYQHSPGPTARASLNLFFAIGAGFSILVLWFNDLMTLRDGILALILLPGLLLGSWLAVPLMPFMDKRFRPLVLTVCVLSALAILGRSFL